ncbi:Hpt domain-containing protein [Sphingobacterium daejeonense]|uniref:Hpt domain-containing protein n=1 Tax=Sphingobacterium daejeonense TaxID=371142 RepID=UPI0010C4E7E6|nr:Hpt domain-containing protein [Sphingobacterium daejeonense]VTP96348.1 Uncharacterised protein [Sphingobacterium daejeonense]
MKQLIIDADFKKEFVGLIIHELQLQEMSINQVIEEQDTDLLKRTLHKLKGTSSTFWTCRAQSNGPSNG